MSEWRFDFWEFSQTSNELLLWRKVANLWSKMWSVLTCKCIKDINTNILMWFFSLFKYWQKITQKYKMLDLSRFFFFFLRNYWKDAWGGAQQYLLVNCPILCYVNGWIALYNIYVYIRPEKDVGARPCWANLGLRFNIQASENTWLKSSRPLSAIFVCLLGGRGYWYKNSPTRQIIFFATRREMPNLFFTKQI